MRCSASREVAEVDISERTSLQSVSYIFRDQVSSTEDTAGATYPPPQPPPINSSISSKVSSKRETFSRCCASRVSPLISRSCNCSICRSSLLRLRRRFSESCSGRAFLIVGFGRSIRPFSSSGRETRWRGSLPLFCCNDFLSSSVCGRLRRLLAPFHLEGPGITCPRWTPQRVETPHEFPS